MADQLSQPVTCLQFVYYHLLFLIQVLHSQTSLLMTTVIHNVTREVRHSHV